MMGEIEGFKESAEAAVQHVQIRAGDSVTHHADYTVTVTDAAARSALVIDPETLASEKRGMGKHKGAERQCALSRDVLPADALIRFVASPEGVVTPDIWHKLPGRGMWLTARKDVVLEAMKRKVFGRALKSKQALSVPEDLAELVDRLMRQDVLQHLALANKAGVIAAGFTKIESAAAKGLYCLFHAREAGEDGIEKLQRAIWRAAEHIQPPLIVKEFTVDELSLFLGRENVIHAALRPAPISVGVVKKFRSYMSFLGKDFSDGARER